MIMAFPLTRLIIGTVVGTPASIVPLVIAAFPFVARLAESSLREISPNTIEMAQSMGASPLQIIVKVMIPESIPSLISNATIAITTILGYSAMSGIIGGGLGKIAINYGYYRYKYPIMLVAVILLIILVQIFQSVGTRLAAKLDKRLKNKLKRAGQEFFLSGLLCLDKRANFWQFLLPRCAAQLINALHLFFIMRGRADIQRAFRANDQNLPPLFFFFNFRRHSIIVFMAVFKRLDHTGIFFHYLSQYGQQLIGCFDKALRLRENDNTVRVAALFHIMQRDRIRNAAVQILFSVYFHRR